MSTNFVEIFRRKMTLNFIRRKLSQVLNCSVGLFLFFSCSTPTDTPESISLTEEFSAYWFGGEAELTSYSLEQARYGEIHPGHAVLIYVTEDFSRSKHVKLDYPGESGSDAVKVMKLNATRKFNTGVYPYSMMTSVFVPLNYDLGSCLKVTTSSQEWCGHTFSQYNNRGDRGEWLLRSYFESEGDVLSTTSNELLEDELWLTIRLNPGELPIGDIEVVPSSMYARLIHRVPNAEKAIAELITTDSISTYSLTYKNFQRSLSINFDTEFPHQIQGWTEAYQSGYGSNAKTLTTKARLNRRIMLDYWSKNSLADSTWRKELDL